MLCLPMHAAKWLYFVKECRAVIECVAQTFHHVIGMPVKLGMLCVDAMADVKTEL